MKDADIAEGHAVTNEVKIDLHMLRALVLDGIGGEIRGRDVVAVNDGRTRRGAADLLQKLAQPTRFRNRVGDGPVFSFGARARHGCLSFRGPGNEVVAEVHEVAGDEASGARAYAVQSRWRRPCRPACVRAPRPISICIGHKLQRSGGA